MQARIKTQQIMRRRHGPPKAADMPAIPGAIQPEENRVDPAFSLPDSETEKLNVATLFSRPAPLIVELGAGKGRFIISHALSHPELNHIAVEWSAKYFRTIAERAGKRGLENVQVCRAEAANFVTNHLPDHSVSACHIYHPDPWPKKRHHRRRLMRPAFLNALYQTLRSDGVLIFQTDHDGYYRYAKWVIGHWFTVEEHPAPWPDNPGGRTNYEIKALQAGWPVHRLVCSPRDAIPSPAETAELERLPGPRLPK